MQMNRGRSAKPERSPCFLVLCLHLSAQKACHRLHQLLVPLGRRGLLFIHEKHHTAHQISLSHNGGSSAKIIFLGALYRPKLHITGTIPVALPLLHQVFQIRRVSPVHQLPPGRAGQGNDGIPIRHSCNPPRIFPNGLTDLGRKVLEVPHGRVFPENHASILLCVNFQRISLPNAQSTADFLGNHHPPQIVPLCQVGAKKFYKLSEKPLISMALGFPDGATMHLRDFERLCYFRSKFDRFAPK